MRLTANARLALGDDGTVTIVVKQFSVSLDKRESAALWKTCGKPVENLLTPVGSQSYIPVPPVPTSTLRESTVPIGTVSTERTRQVDQEIKGFTPKGTTPGDIALEAILRVLHRTPTHVLSHEAIREAVYSELEPTVGPLSLNAVTMEAWSVTFWRSRPELHVGLTTISLSMDQR